MLGTVRVAVAAAALFGLAVPASAAAVGLPTPCSGSPIDPDRVITGEFGTQFSKSFVMVPFEVPRATTAIRVKYCFDRPSPARAGTRSTWGCTNGAAGTRASGVRTSSAAGAARATRM